MENEIYEKKKLHIFPLFPVWGELFIYKYPPLPSFSLIFGEKKKKKSLHKEL